IDKIIFGRYQDKPIWEVKSGSDFYLVDFETGALVNKEGL
ncbi:peptidase, partial [Klebsiella pneumoniae]|nr:peptidase [Klebsiella pneumoniae]